MPAARVARLGVTTREASASRFTRQDTMKSIYRYLSLLTLSLLTVGGHAADLTADRAVELAQKNNPELRAAASLVRAAEARARTTGRLANPEVEAEFAGGQDSEGRISVALAQRFPVTSRLSRERKLSRLEVELAKAELREQTAEIAAAAREAFYKLAAARESLALAKKNARAAAAFSTALQSRVAEGAASALESAQSELETESLIAREAALGADEAIERAGLANLLGQPADAPLVLRDALTLPSRLPANRAPENHPSVRRAALAAEAGAADVDLARALTWDDLGVALFAEGERFRDEPEGIEPEALLGVRLNIPFPLWQNGAGKIAEKTATSEASTARLAGVQLAARNAVTASYQAMKARYRSADQLATRVLPLATKHIADTEAAYSRGETGAEAVFRARQRLAEIETAALDARQHYFLAYAAWLRAIGATSLP